MAFLTTIARDSLYQQHPDAGAGHWMSLLCRKMAVVRGPPIRNEIVEPARKDDGEIVCQERLGGLLKSYRGVA
jgi:hypothetical protein